MRNKQFIALLVLASAFLMAACAEDANAGGKIREKNVSMRWDFYNIRGWEHTQQDDAPVPQYYLEGDSLVIYTRANTRDRQKMRTVKNNFTSGTYEWKILIPEIAPRQQVSVAGFLYSDDLHEIDFEIGYGTQKARASCGAIEGELVACMTNQGNPFFSGYVPIKPGWHIFALRLDVVSSVAEGPEEQRERYAVTWLIDGKEAQKLDLEFGPEYSFDILCSVENLLFIGDVIPEHDTYAKFDYVSFDGKVKRSNFIANNIFPE